MSVDFAAKQRQLFLSPVEPWTSLSYCSWSDDGEPMVGFVSGEREWKQRADDLTVEGVADSPKESDFPEIPDLGRIRMTAGSTSEIELPLERPAVCCIEISPLEETSLGDLELLIGKLLDPEIGAGMAEYGKRERLIRYRSERRDLPRSLASEGVTCLDLRMPRIKPRWGDASKMLEVSQRWLRIYFNESWVVGLWSPPVPARGRPWCTLPRQRRIGSGMRNLPFPEEISGPTLAMRMIQEVAGGTNGAIKRVGSELDLWEQSLMRGPAEGRVGTPADLEDLDCLSVQLSGLGKFLWDVGEDVVMLRSRGESESTLPDPYRGELAGYVGVLDKELAEQRERVRQAFDLLTAAATNRSFKLEQRAQDRRRHLEILIGLLAAAAVVPGVILAAAEIYDPKALGTFGASIGLAILGTVLIAVLLILVLRKDEPLKGLEQQIGSGITPGPEDTGQVVAAARDQRGAFEWDPEWPPAPPKS